MFNTETKLNYTVCAEAKEKVTVIIMCAGSSSRMGDIDKLTVKLDGKELFLHSVLKFQNNPKISNIVIVTRKENILFYQNKILEYELTKVTDIVEGGSCREESVKNGLFVIKEPLGYVLIHDGARPFVTDECIDRVIMGAVKHNACICTVKSKDTIKVVNEDGMVVSTPNRDALVSVQTPQGFKTNILKKSFEKYADKLASFTDDASLVEKNGYNIYTVDGDYKNIKITTLEDLKFAEFMLSEDK